jgi:hypothetical protein
MGTNNEVGSDVLHSTNHSKLSAEEIAKAVARHNREHKGQAAAAQQPKAKKSGK